MFEEQRSQSCWRSGSEIWASSCWSRCCSPKPAITLASPDHHRHFVPSLVPNHPSCALKVSSIKTELDPLDLPQKKCRASLCVGCGAQIHDQYILRVAPDLEWHAACLKCADCQQFLDETCTCFVRDGKTYCKRDYVRLFGTKCDKCNLSFNKNDFVMRAKTKIYHIDCFRCNACQKQLIPGDEFALREDGLFCKEDHEELSSKSNNSVETNNNNSNNSNSNVASNGNNTNSTVVSSTNGPTSSLHHHNEGSNSDSSESGSNPRYGSGGREVNSRGTGTKVSSDGKPTRVRTVLNEKQLHTLRTCYSANPRPDALMKEQLVDMTGLSPRVIRVWFQNKRCKDKKRAIALKQQAQNDKEGRKMGYGSMQGIPMIASSPVRHESPIGVNPIEVQSYPAPWKALSDFALHTDLERLDSSAPHFQQLVNQMHGYDIHRPPLAIIPPHELIHHTAPPPDMIPQDSGDSLVTYMESDDSIPHDSSSP